MPGTEQEWDQLRNEVLRDSMLNNYSERRLPRFVETVPPPKQEDEVNHPKHYNANGGVECVDYIKQQLGHDGFIAYCEGNVIKYGHRWRYKNGIQDLKKKKWYLDKMIEELEKCKLGA